MNGQRFSTAICFQCDRGLVAGKTPDELIYERTQEERNQADKVRDEIGPNMFKAKGFKQRVRDAVSEITKNIASRRRKITEE